MADETVKLAPIICQYSTPSFAKTLTPFLLRVCAEPQVRWLEIIVRMQIRYTTICTRRRTGIPVISDLNPVQVLGLC